MNAAYKIHWNHIWYRIEQFQICLGLPLTTNASVEIVGASLQAILCTYHQYLSLRKTRYVTYVFTSPLSDMHSFSLLGCHMSQKYYSESQIMKFYFLSTNNVEHLSISVPPVVQFYCILNSFFLCICILNWS